MLNQVYSLANLEKAWNWIKSNPDRMYKGYFRESYRNHEIVSTAFISNTREELRDNTYEPSPACKIFFPKPSGILRPYTLLTVKDQLVYQAFANIIAERLNPLIQSRYNNKNFGHQYAGRDSIWFYKKWSEGYSSFNKAAANAFNEGKTYSASFDLTACYDSIDHGVLTHFLRGIGLSHEFCERLCRYLSVWTATDHEEPIFQHHGIPQGPLSSGILSEVVLKAFDDETLTKGVSYFRYVDDIRLFSASEDSLRSELVKLDGISKKIGLFPQSSKIGIHKIKNIEDELKNLSHPGSFLPFGKYTQKDVVKKILSVTPRYKIENISRLKYFVAMSRPNNLVVDRLWKIYESQPHIYSLLCSALKKYQSIPIQSYKRILKELQRPIPYPAVHAEFISVLLQTELNPNQLTEVSKLIKKRFYAGGKALLKGEISLSMNVCKLLIKANKFTEKQLRYVASAPYWYTRYSVSEALSASHRTEVSPHLTKLMKEENGDVSLSAASGLVENHFRLPRQPIQNNLSPVFLESFGLSGVRTTQCKIDHAVRAIFSLQNSFPSVDWRRLLGREYRHALNSIILCKSNHSVSASGWILDLDAFNEIVIRRLHDQDGSIGVVPNNYGAAFTALTQPPNLFRTKYRTIHDCAQVIHSRRTTSVSAHPYQTRSGNRNTIFRHSEKRTYIRREITLLRQLASLFPVV